MSEDLTELQRKILSVILQDSHRPSAITRILKNRHIKCDQNQVVEALNDMEERGFVERFTTKAWLATGKAQDLAD